MQPQAHQKPKLKAFVEAARSLVGTKYRHAGRCPHNGVDCVGVPVYAALAVGIAVRDEEAYSRYPDGRLLERMLDYGELAERHYGAIAVFWLDPSTKLPQHVGVVTEHGMVHSYMLNRRVVETTLDDYWLSKVCGYVRVRGL